MLLEHSRVYQQRAQQLLSEVRAKVAELFPAGDAGQPPVAAKENSTR